MTDITSFGSEVAELCRSHRVVNYVMCHAQKYGWSVQQALERMVVELVKADNAKLEELVRMTGERPSFFIKELIK